MRNRNSSTSSGFAHLLGVIIIAGVGISIAVVLITLSTSSLDINRIELETIQARRNADTCTETALLSLVTTDTYAGTEDLTLTKGTCQGVTINTLSGSTTRNIAIQSTGVVENTTRRMSAAGTITYMGTSTPVLSLTSWMEVGSF